ncbi:hypothetical protein CQ11_08065 [Trueperella pyogenes]|nr:hypothetical protein CQ11_08065 [Trueperella pyogenes]
MNSNGCACATPCRWPSSTIGFPPTSPRRVPAWKATACTSSSAKPGWSRRPPPSPWAPNAPTAAKLSSSPFRNAIPSSPWSGPRSMPAERSSNGDSISTVRICTATNRPSLPRKPAADRCPLPLPVVSTFPGFSSRKTLFWVRISGVRCRETNNEHENGERSELETRRIPLRR